MRLNKFLANSLGISRREADELIAGGKVTVGKSVARIGEQISPDQLIKIGNKIVKPLLKHTYLLFNKPKGYVCSRSAQGDASTVYELLPGQYKRLKTVGRLDKDSTGLILLTNDGDLSYQLTHPKFAKEKVYLVELDEPLTSADKNAIERGVEIGDGLSKFRLQELEGSEGGNTTKTKFLVYLQEGRNRQIRRTFLALGRKVISLHRIKFGPYELGGLKIGEYREVRDEKLATGK